MSDQLTAFPPTESDLLRRYLLRLEVEAEKLTGSLVKTRTRLDETMDELAQVRRLLDAAPVAQPDGYLDRLEHGVDVLLGEVPPDGVYATWSDDDGKVTKFVKCGDRTRFSALIYAVAEQLGIVDVIDSEWTIVAAEDGSLVDQKHVITADDHGREFVVVRMEP